MPNVEKQQDLFWQVTCESICVPLARVGTDNRFIWVNDAFSRLVGYSATELCDGMTWIEITSDEDVGSDLRSIREVTEGKRMMYVMEKRYRRKHGEEVDVNLTVIRYPPGFGAVVCFIVHAMPKVAYQKTVEDLGTLVHQIQGRLDRIMSSSEQPDRNDTRQTSTTSGVNISIGSNDYNFPKWVVGVILALIFAAMYLAYLGGWNLHKGNAKPPTLPTVELQE